MNLRNLREDETDLLKDFLYEAIFIPEGVKPPPREIIEQSELKLYYEDFGSSRADNCIVAEDDGRVVGTVWTRIMNDYGHVDDETPSFAISLYKEYRGQGIGTRLMNEMLELLDMDVKSLTTDSKSVGGWVTEQLGDIPKKGSSFRYDNLEFTVDDVEDNRINTITVVRMPKEEKDDE